MLEGTIAVVSFGVATKFGPVIKKFGAKVANKVSSSLSKASSKVSRTLSKSAKTKSFWPPNEGFLGKPKKITLEVGTKIDRYGYPGGKYVSPKGTPYEMRSLAPGSELKPYHSYTVKKSIKVKAGPAAPWFGQPGGGMQYKFNKPISRLGRYLQE